MTYAVGDDMEKTFSVSYLEEAYLGAIQKLVLRDSVLSSSTLPRDLYILTTPRVHCLFPTPNFSINPSSTAENSR